jgi:hypothetical protein
MKRLRREDSKNEDDYSSDESSSSRRRHSKKSDKHKKSHKRKHKHKHRKKDRHRRHRDEDESDSDSSHRKKDRKRRHDSSSRSRKRKSEKKKPHVTAEVTSNDILAQAICGLLEDRPSFCGDLSIMLIRLVGGTTFNLQQMTDEVAAKGLERVFESLAIYGVQKNKSNDLWMFIPPAGASSRDELVLLKVIRSILDELGVNMSAVQQYEKEELSSETKQQLKTEKDERIEAIKTSTAKLLNDFKDVDSNLGKQLVEICKTILAGESLCIDGLPNAKLKDSLGAIFEQCGLEKTEMENDDDSDDDEDAEKEILLGYGLPENHDDGEVKLKLASFIETCDHPPIQKQTRRVLGPQRPPNNVGDYDDEGPVPLGVENNGHALSLELLQARLQKQAAEEDAEEEGREEWMLVPGKHDFLDSVKTGPSIKSRGFKNEKAPDSEVPEEIDPSIQKEMDSIMEAHKEARGPSLFTQHRAKKQQEKQESSGKEGDFKWSRDNDLDSGRRVDKDALKLMLGGAATNLQKKFQGGFNR